ncbi:hypothetical protein ACFL2U_03015, partial [Patescibacteria group bacterium]
MLSEKARKHIFGLAFESIFEAGQTMEIMNLVQDDDFAVAVLTFKSRWEKIIKILIELGGWITQEEATELVPLFLKSHGIKNDEIWQEVVFTDNTIYMWTQSAIFYNKEIVGKEKQEQDRIALIRAILSSHMIDTRINQEHVMLKRERFVFQQELILAAKKIASFHLKTTAEELKELIALEFPKIADTRMEHVDVVFQSILAKYIPVEINLMEALEGIEEVADTTKLTEPTIEPLSAAEEADVDAMFDKIQLPPMETKESIALPGSDGKSMEVTMKPTIHQVNANGIVSTLKSLIPKFTIDEIQERAMEELRNFKKHGRNLNKLDVLWEILKLAERKLTSEHDKDVDTEDMRKLGKLVIALSMYKIEIG